MPKKTQQKKEKELTEQEIKIKQLQELSIDLVNQPVTISISTKEKEDRHIASGVLIGIAPLAVTGAKLPLKPRNNKMPKVVNINLDSFTMPAVIDDMSVYVIGNGIMLKTDSVVVRITKA